MSRERKDICLASGQGHCTSFHPFNSQVFGSATCYIRNADTFLHFQASTGDRFQANTQFFRREDITQTGGIVGLFSKAYYENTWHLQAILDAPTAKSLDVVWCDGMELSDESHSGRETSKDPVTLCKSSGMTFPVSYDTSGAFETVTVRLDSDQPVLFRAGVSAHPQALDEGGQLSAYGTFSSGSEFSGIFTESRETGVLELVSHLSDREFSLTDMPVCPASATGLDMPVIENFPPAPSMSGDISSFQTKTGAMT